MTECLYGNVFDLKAETRLVHMSKNKTWSTIARR